LIGEKVAFALKNGVKVIACIGEKLEDRQANQTMKVIISQLEGITSQISASLWDNIVLAYEPVWAIGTGVVATPDQAQETQQQIRDWISKNVSPQVAEKVRIMYGGSVNAKNCADLQSQKDIDGFLVGGASLKPQEFLTICKCKL
jgi:triosephosphate isomerase (TIM)